MSIEIILFTLIIVSTSSVQVSAINPKLLKRPISLNKNSPYSLKPEQNFHSVLLDSDADVDANAILGRMQRGGNSQNGSSIAQDTTRKVERRQRIISSTKLSLSSIIGIIIIKQIYENRGRLPSREDIQNYTFKAATNVKQKGNIGVFYFMLALACFETFGISTCPIEISGGFVFGIRRGFFINIFGKLFGAMTAYIIGRNFLSTSIASKFLKNDEDSIAKKDDRKSDKIINLIQTCIVEEPITTALVLR